LIDVFHIAPISEAGKIAICAAFSRVFFAATASLVVAFIGLLLLKEKPLQTNLPPPRR